MQGIGPCSTEADVKTLETATFHRPAARCCAWATRTMASKRVLLGADGKAVFFGGELGLNKSLIEAGLATNLK